MWPNKRSWGEGPQNTQIQGLALLFLDYEMLVGHLIPLCFNFPNYKISIFTSLNYSSSKLLDWLTLPCLCGKGVWHTRGCSVRYWRLGDKTHAFKTRKLTAALNRSILSTTFILLYKLLLVLTDKLLRSWWAHPRDQNLSFLNSGRKPTRQPTLWLPPILQSLPSDIYESTAFSSSIP